MIPDGRGGKLILMGEPIEVEWYREGRTATREEVLASIRSGLPILEAMAREERGGLEALAVSREQFERWIPRAKEVDNATI